MTIVSLHPDPVDSSPVAAIRASATIGDIESATNRSTGRRRPGGICSATSTQVSRFGSARYAKRQSG